MLSPDIYSASDVIGMLQLEPLPHEGGWFRRTGEGSGLRADASARRGWSSILALFTPDGFSALHRLAADEIWCFHAGDALTSLRLHPGGSVESVTLGFDLTRGERVQDIVRAGIWQGTCLRAGGRWALVSCVVAPEFRWEDFELGRRSDLQRQFPAWAETIARLTRD